ncbi:hypothetical protein AVEN_71961-1 [Araneus ventricosus]|uniref:Uncharacterized protein n=1 Tax=Araneus ventricosus TaxID=182803 RepID=A0A4Y2F7Q3_ARAVE|nr:hypothetical protein AVEN_71961-1 [Araneus ventricosus]
MSRVGCIQSPINHPRVGDRNEVVQFLLIRYCLTFRAFFERMDCIVVFPSFHPREHDVGGKVAEFFAIHEFTKLFLPLRNSQFIEDEKNTNKMDFN